MIRVGVKCIILMRSCGLRLELDPVSLLKNLIGRQQIFVQLEVWLRWDLAPAPDDSRIEPGISSKALPTEPSDIRSLDLV